MKKKKRRRRRKYDDYATNSGRVHPYAERYWYYC